MRWSEFLAVRLAGPYFVRLGAAAAQAGSWLPGSIPGSVLGSTKARSLLVCACRAAVAARVRAPSYTGPGAAWWLLNVSTKYSGFIVPFTGPILAIASGRTWFSAALEHPWLVLLVEASHSLFMIHWPVISFLARGWLGLQGTPLVHAAFLLATVGVSVVCYRRVELPCRAWLRGMPIEGQRNLE